MSNQVTFTQPGQERPVLLAKNSEAYALYEESKKRPELVGKLNQHLKSLDVKNLELIRRYEPKEQK